MFFFGPPVRDGLIPRKYIPMLKYFNNPPLLSNVSVSFFCFLTTGDLLEHMKNIHQRFFCGLCLDNRPLFVSEQDVFTATALRKHDARVDGGHPLCRFCSQR